MKHRVWFTILSAALMNSMSVAQIVSRFDLTANGSLGNAQLVGAPSGAQQRAFGWQTSGISHFNSWLGLASQFSAGYASANSIQLIGYTGYGTIQRYSSLMGPRITFASRSRINPYVEGLGGIDYARTKFSSNGTIVTGRELESAYSIGGGAQINMTRRIGFNVEAHYFETNHTVALLGWMPSHLQISAGLVFRLSNLRDRRILVDQQPLPVPSPSETQTASTESESASTPVPAAPVTTMIVTAPTSTDSFARPQPAVKATTENHVAEEKAVASPAPKAAPPAVVVPVTAMAITAAPNSETKARPQPVVQATTESHVAQQQAVIAPAPKPAPTAVAKSQPSAVITPKVTTPALNQTTRAQSQAQKPASASASTVATVVPTRPVQTQVQAAQAQPTPTPRPFVSSTPANTYTTAPSQPLSLGEYARKLREQKQQHKQADWQ